MKKKLSWNWLSIAICTGAWLVVMFFLSLVTFSLNNPYSYNTNWFSGNKAQIVCPQVFGGSNGLCETDVLYSSVGFPVEYSNDTTSGPYWLVWTINIGLLGLVGIGLGYLIYRKHRLGLLVGLALIAIAVLIR